MNIETGEPDQEYEMLVLSFSKGHPGNFAQAGCRLKPESSYTDGVMWAAKLIVGLGMYLSCFPDQIKAGIPDDLKHSNYYQGQRRTIGISEKVIIRDGPTPHYRVGHFRMLQSARYKNKKGQVVFVHGCFVKGKAETVLTP